MNDTARKILNGFRPELLTAFFKMIKGINVELSDTGKEETKDCEDNSRWWFISAINEDESINIISQGHTVFENAKLSWLKLTD